MTSSALHQPAPRGPAELGPVLEATRHALSQRFGGRLLRPILFGSYATGRVHEDSDVDVLVLLSDRAAGDVDLAAEAAVQVMMQYPDVVLSPIVMSDAELDALRRRERRFARDVDAEGIAF